MNRKPITAKELLQQLEADPKWVAERDARELRHRKRAEALSKDEAGLLNDLEAVGVRVSSVYDFVNSPPASLEAMLVLVRHLDIPHLPNIREGIIRALSVSSARDYAQSSLVEQFRRENDPDMKWVIANALSAMVGIEELDGLEGIIKFSHLFGRRKKTKRPSRKQE